MAPMWIAAALALADAADDRPRLERFAQQAARSPAAVARLAADLIAGDEPLRGRRVVTCSFSGAVLACCRALAARAPLRVACAEGRPAFEGRRLATLLAADGIAVDFYSDAGIGEALEGSAALVLGADAVAPGWFVNKTGTAALAALAQYRGVPAYLLAGREKFLPDRLAALVSLSGGPPGELWEAPPAGVDVRNCYFERIPLEFVAAVVTDTGVAEAGAVAEICDAVGRQLGDGVELLSLQAALPAPGASGNS
jgi:translation initiation factor 2B subunit (eIF-2B alpha/beta/delta family)